MKAKFEIGDPARFSDRCPAYVKEGHLFRTRIIIDKMYDSKRKCSFYELAGRGKGRMGHWLRSFMLRTVSEKERHTLGRPIITISPTGLKDSEADRLLVSTLYLKARFVNKGD